jgi:hypothetical protein
MDKNILSKATAATEEPTSGWMYHAIAKMTKESPTTCDNIVNWLLNRLNDNNLHTKKKVLIVIKNVAQQGDAEFARTLTKKTENIKSYASFRGPPDPLHGDALNQAIRIAAQQAVEAIFERNESGDRIHSRMYEGMEGSYNSYQSSTTGLTSWIGIGSNTTNDGYSNATTNPYSGGGIGNHSYTHTGGITPSYGGKYQGIGNPNMQQQTAQPGILERVGSYMPTLSGVTSYIPGLSKKPYTPDTSFLDTDSSLNTYNPIVVPGRLSGRGGLDTYVGGGSKDWRESPTSPTMSKESNNTLEQRLVDEFTQVAGVKLQPSRSDTSQFVNKCVNVDINAVADLLYKKLHHKQWQVRLKALFAIEALLRSNNEDVRAYFNNHYDEIGEFTEAVQESVATRARRVLKMLDSEEVEEEDVVTTPKKGGTPVIEYNEPEPQFKPRSSSPPLQEPVYQSQQQEQKVKQSRKSKFERQLFDEPKEPQVAKQPQPQQQQQNNTRVKQQPQQPANPPPKKVATPLLIDPYEDDVIPEPQEPPKPQEPQPIRNMDDIFSNMTINEQPTQNEIPQEQARKRGDSSALMNNIGRYFDAHTPSSGSPISPAMNSGRTTQQYPPNTIHQQIVYVAVPMNPQIGFQPIGFPVQSMGPPRMMPQQQSRMPVAPQSKGGFDFMNKANNNNEESEVDTHFDFVKQEIAQSTRK